jgi:hypothetical protein
LRQRALRVLHVEHCRWNGHHCMATNGIGLPGQLLQH